MPSDDEDDWGEPLEKVKVIKKTRPPPDPLRNTVVQIALRCHAEWFVKTEHGIQTVSFTELRDLQKCLALAEKLIGEQFRLVKLGESGLTYQKKFEFLPKDLPHKEAVVEAQIRLRESLMENLKLKENSQRGGEEYSSGGTYSAREVSRFMHAVSAGCDVRVDRRIWNNTFR